jgi:hypothetical protein
MGVELSATKSRGNPIATHTGQSFFTGDSSAASMIHLKLGNMKQVSTSTFDYFTPQSECLHAPTILM